MAIKFNITPNNSTLKDLQKNVFTIFHVMKAFKSFVVILLFLTSIPSLAQEENVKVLEKQNGTRLAFFAINEDDKPYDVLFEVKGSNFRQSAARARWIRIPATSKVHLKTIVPERGKTPKYTYTLQINDSLSRRALKKEFTII